MMTGTALLVRRHRYTGTLSYYRCWTPGPVPLSKLIAIAVARRRIEEDHQLTKQATGLDAGQVSRWKSWHRWTVICLLAYIYSPIPVPVQRRKEVRPRPGRRADPDHRARAALALARRRHPPPPA